jgi:outer membrane protein assembly factor BamB
MRQLLTCCLFASALFAGHQESQAASPAGVAASDPVQIGPTDWPWWRGPKFDGIALGNQHPPLTWSDAASEPGGKPENVVWKTPIIGRGHGSPTIVGDRIYLATADVEAQVQSVLALDRASGKPLWQTPVHQGNFDPKGNLKSSHASSTVACDGRRLFINFLNAGAIHTSALDLDGKVLWQTKVCDFVNHQGFGSSPAIYKQTVIVSADNKGGGAIVALERASGKVIWRVDRPSLPNYTSPIIFTIAGREQLLLTGCDLVTSLDPATGAKLWEVAGATTECVTSTVTDGQRIFTSGGYPKNHLSAVEADGSGKLAWESATRVYVPSMLVNDGHLYAVLDAGVATCWNSATGEELWKQRVGGTFSASPVLVGDKIFAIDEKGRTVIFRASPKEFEQLGENTLGDEAFATPTFVDDRIYFRVAKTTDGKRQEYVYCIGK